jgi:GNAT superfamily N-acetyltransferase
MKKELPGGFELDDSSSRIDLRETHRFLSIESYWAQGRPFEIQERLIREAQRVVGLYHDDRLIGFSRTVSDGTTVTYLADVYVLPEFRGRGLGTELVRFTVEEGPYAEARWLLHTADAHSLYEKFGFTPPSARVMERQAPG